MIAQKRGKNLAIAGCFAHLVLAAVMLIIWQWAHSLSALSSTMMLLGGLPLWLMVAMLFYVRQLARREEREVEELAASGAVKGTIFETEQGEQFRPAASRVAFVDRWIVPLFTLLWAALLGVIAFLLVRYLRTQQAHEIVNFAPAVMVAVVAGFAAFLFSRYATGMSRAAEWLPLRATGSYLLVNVLGIVAVVACLVAASQAHAEVDLYAAYAVPVILAVLVVELLLNFVLDLYRPRLPDQEYHPSFDSRLLDLLAEPSRVGHSIADTLNYQFGFEVSRTWFYQLLAKAALPLLMFAGLVLVAISSVVIVRDGEQCVVLHWGKVDRVLTAGLHFKWPWPVDRADRFDTAREREILLGAGGHREPTMIKGREIDLWTEEHGSREELDFLIAVPPESRMVEVGEGQKSPPVSIIKLVVAVHYVIDDVQKFGYQYQDAAKQLENEAYREMVRYCATATLDSPLPGDAAAEDRPEAIMTYGRERAAKELQKRIEPAARELGVRITYVGVYAAHPPASAAEAFEEVFEAERRMDQKRYEAEGDAYQTLAEVTGDPEKALELASAIRSLEQLRDVEQLRKDPGEAKRSVEAALRAMDDNIASLRREIERDRLLGAAREGRQTAKERLLKRHEEYRELLGQAAADINGFDYTAAIQRYSDEAQELFDRTTGRAAVLVAQAQADRWNKELSERGRYEAFRRELLAYQASRQVYTFDRWMDVWDEVLPGVSKYVIGVDNDRVETWLNWERQRGTMEGAFQETPKK